MVTIATPLDKEIAALSEKIAATSVPYGSARQQLEVAAKNSAGAAASAPVAADRAAYNAKDGKAIQGRGDLVNDVREKLVKLDDIDANELPKELQSMSRDELIAHLDRLAGERAELSKQVTELSRKRQAFIDEESKKRSGDGDSFDQKIAEIVEAELLPTK